MKKGRVIDYVTILSAGGSKHEVGSHVEREIVEKANESLKGKKRIEFKPYSFYLSAWQEDEYLIAQANVEMDARGRIVSELVNVRQSGNFVLKHREEVDFVDVSPKQLVSVAASLIPFLENDDANRAFDGIEHAAAGSAITSDRRAAGGNRDGGDHCSGLRSCSRLPPKRRCRFG